MGLSRVRQGDSSHLKIIKKTDQTRVSRLTIILPVFNTLDVLFIMN